MKRYLFLTICLTCLGFGNSKALDIVAMDNTNNLALTPATSLGSVSTINWNAKVFSLGVDNAVIKQLVMPLYVTTAVSRTINLALYAADGSNLPTGTALATDTYTQTFTTSATYYTIATTLGGYTMQSGQKYALVFSATSGTGTLSWSGASTAGNYSTYTAASGWTFLNNARTTNSGSSWTTNPYYNGLQMTVTSIPVPEPSTTILAGAAVVGLALMRGQRRRTIITG